MAINAYPKRTDFLIDAPLNFAPENELGVVYLFCHLAKKWRIKVDQIRAGFPDCIAYQKVAGGERPIRIEFEFKAANFRVHGHDPKKCDWVVCWENNWLNPPENLHILELRKEFGLGFNLWIMPVKGRHWQEGLIRDKTATEWTVPAQANIGDLVLFYFTSPVKALNSVFIIKEKPKQVKANWHGKKTDYTARMKNVAWFKSPLFLEDLKRHKVLKTGGFVRGNLIGRPKVTDYWPWLHDAIASRNPSSKKALLKFAPENL